MQLKVNSTEFWNSFKYTLFMQQIYCISQFYRRPNQTFVSVRSKFWFYLNIFLFFGILCGGILTNFDKSWKFQFTVKIDSYLWKFIGVSEAIATTVIYTVTMFSIKNTTNLQIDFLHKIYSVDVILIENYHKIIQYSALKCYNVIFLIIFIGYYTIGLILIICTILSTSATVKFGIFAYILPYIYQFSLSTLIGFCYINYVNMIRIRFRILKEIAYEWNLYENIEILENRNKNNNILIIFETYQMICDAIELLNKSLGDVVFYQILHDFTIITMILYFMCWTALSKSNVKIFLLSLLTFWISQFIIKVCVEAIIAELTIQEV